MIHGECTITTECLVVEKWLIAMFMLYLVDWEMLNVGLSCSAEPFTESVVHSYYNWDGLLIHTNAICHWMIYKRPVALE